MFGNPVSAQNHRRQRTDGELRGYPAIYIGPSDMAPQGHVITSRYGKGYVTSNDIIHGEDFQWVTHDDGPFTPTNRPPGTCQYDKDIRAIEQNNTLVLREIYRDWAYLRDGPVGHIDHKSTSQDDQIPSSLKTIVKIQREHPSVKAPNTNKHHRTITTPISNPNTVRYDAGVDARRRRKMRVNPQENHPMRPLVLTRTDPIRQNTVTRIPSQSGAVWDVRKRIMRHG
jgi:hypothetical protein